MTFYVGVVVGLIIWDVAMKILRMTREEELRTVGVVGDCFIGIALAMWGVWLLAKA